jgi:ubiquinone/menaquinone biosynthesis C-methylase UbiE
MHNNAEKLISNFYNTHGWKTKNEITEDAKRWEDLRPCATEYVSKCRLRVLEHIPNQGEYILDMASGPIQYNEYLEYSKGFNKRYCIDLSKVALEDAKKKIGDHGIFLCGSFFDIELKDNFFDCTISIHTLYHIDKDKQEKAVRKLLDVTKPESPIIIVYSNPHTLIKRIISPIKYSYKLFKKSKPTANNPEFYFFQHSNDWWTRFNDVADIRILPWRSFSSDHQKMLIPNNRFGKRILKCLFNIENKYPDFFVKHFQYPMIILMKRKIC